MLPLNDPNWLCVGQFLLTLSDDHNIKHIYLMSVMKRNYSNIPNQWIHNQHHAFQQEEKKKFYETRKQKKWKNLISHINPLIYELHFNSDSYYRNLSGKNQFIWLKKDEEKLN